MNAPVKYFAGVHANAWESKVFKSKSKINGTEVLKVIPAHKVH